MSTVAERIRMVREAHELSQSAFATRIGISVRSVHTLEYRATSASVDVVAAVAIQWPEYSYWLLTGKVNSKVGQTKPKTISVRNV
ncbi:MAG TPA: helix-turn-helix transcriptional regulator [Gammaproteobacteria bacterium]